MNKQQVEPYQEEVPSWFPDQLVEVYNLLKQTYHKEAEEYCLKGNEHALLYASDSIIYHYHLHYLAKKLFCKKHKLPSLHRETAVTVKPTAELYYQLFKIIDLIMSLGPSAYKSINLDNPFLSWLRIMQEGTFETKFFSNGENWSKTEIIQRLQSENRLLQSHEVNPFRLESNPRAYLLVEYCLAIVETPNNFSEKFKKLYWMPMVKARMEMTKATKESRNELWFNYSTLEYTVPEFKGKLKYPLNSILKNKNL